MAGPRQASSVATPLEEARVLIVEAINDELLAGATAAIAAAGATFTHVTVPGALEVPSTMAILIEAAEGQGQPYDAAVALGCVIRGETYHFEIVSGESARALMDHSVAYGLPLGNGILTVENEDQAWARARVGAGNKGGGAAEAALEVLRLKRRAIAGGI